MITDSELKLLTAKGVFGKNMFLENYLKNDTFGTKKKALEEAIKRKQMEEEEESFLTIDLEDE